MGDYNQERQHVRGDQYNAEGNINQYRNRNYYAQGDIHNDHRRYVENVGRDKAGHDVVHNQYKVDTSGFKSIGRAIALYAVLSILFAAGVVGGVAWYLSSHPLPGIGSFGSNPSSDLDQTLYGTPQDALKQFCNHLASGDLQGAYDVYSSHLKSQISLDQFTQTWSGNNAPEHCISNITTAASSSAQGILSMSKTSLDGSDFSTHTTQYNVSLVSNNGIWQIDSWQEV